ncbi:hypothetical protein FOA52_013049 [Chlamydomonas sp. UWO 241]|nr:hypothetical protein FOA52_013049 [Chlamydomonas sp. UWO 241]
MRSWWSSQTRAHTSQQSVIRQSRIALWPENCSTRASPPSDCMKRTWRAAQSGGDSSRVSVASRMPTTRTSRTATVEVVAGRRSAKIAGRKGKSDALRAKLFARSGKKIVMLVKAGGPDPVTNAALELAIRQAKEAGVPRDIVDRNLKRASDSKQADYTEIWYEAYGPGGTGFIIQCLTDNLNRSASDIKSTITKAGCKVAEPGSVLFNFTRCGSVVVEGADEDALLEACMEAGGEDVVPVPEDEDGTPSTACVVFTAVEAYGSASAKLKELGFKVNTEESELVYRANAPVEVDDDAFHKCEALIEKLLELDDVDAVYTNADGHHV